MRRITQLAAKLDYNQIMVDASNRLHAIINACINKDNDSIICNTCSSMYSCEKDIPKVEEETEHPVLDKHLCFSFKDYDFELSSCNNITHRNQIVGLTMENIKERFPNGIFSDRYVCWMWGHKDCEGHTKEEVDNPEFFAPNIYLVPNAWSWGADDDLNPGVEVNPLILAAINNFLETFKE